MKISLLNNQYDLDNHHEYQKLRQRCETLLSVYNPNAGLSDQELGFYIYTLKIYSDVLQKRQYNDRLFALNQSKNQIINIYNKQTIINACNLYNISAIDISDDFLADSESEYNESLDESLEENISDEFTDEVSLQSFLYEDESNGKVNQQGKKSTLTHGYSFGFFGIEVEDFGGTDAVGQWNFTRLLSSRLRTLAEVYEALIEEKFSLVGDKAKEHIANFNNGSDEFFGYLGAVFFVPRLLEGLAKGIYHAGKDGDFDYLESKINTVINDMSWVTANTMGLFSSIATAATFAGVAFYAVDFFNDLHKGYKKLKAIDDMLEHIDRSNFSGDESKMVNEMKLRLLKQKEYIKAETCVNAVVNGLYYFGSLAMLTNPIAGATVMVAATAVQYYFKNYYLPRKEVQCAHDQLHLLASRLLEHVEKQLQRLEKCGQSDKLEKYKEARVKLKRLLTSDSMDKTQLKQTLDEIIATSRIKRDTSRSSLIDLTSARDLKDTLSAFSSGLFNNGLDKNEHRAILKSIDNFERMSFSKASFSNDKENITKLVEALLNHAKKQVKRFSNIYKYDDVVIRRKTQNKWQKYRHVTELLANLENQENITTEALVPCLKAIIAASEIKRDRFKSIGRLESVQELKGIFKSFADVLESDEINNILRTYQQEHAAGPKMRITIPSFFGPENIKVQAIHPSPEA
ncbi:hypothetical protein L3V82_03760 [Thiotrichales bacterium 19S3-7]|nr:hypothetical protein [Thiotrichales bacterium 19S3-7]MCF6801237.1 hypothetical protein [Thiotrichales bacterium 19S3-11]